MMNYVVNATCEWIKDDYIKLCEVGTCMAMQTKAWMISFNFKEFQ
jgi:hypothetical protein